MERGRDEKECRDCAWGCVSGVGMAGGGSQVHTHYTHTHTNTLRGWLILTCEKKAYPARSCEAKERSDLVSSPLLFFSSSLLLTCGSSVCAWVCVCLVTHRGLWPVTRSTWHAQMIHNLLCVALLKGFVFYNFVQGEKISAHTSVNNGNAVTEVWEMSATRSAIKTLDTFNSLMV